MHDRLIFIMKENEEWNEYNAQVDRLIEELWRSGVNVKTRRFHAQVLVDILCNDKSHRQPIARIYTTSEGPFLVAAIGNDLINRWSHRRVREDTGGVMVRKKNQWFGRINAAEVIDGVRLPFGVRSAVPLARPGVEDMLRHWEETPWDEDDPHPERRLILLCARCGRRPVPAFGDLLGLAARAVELGITQRVTT